MENENGVQYTGASRIEYTVIFNISEVDCDYKILKTIEPKNKIVANYIRCISYVNDTSVSVDFNSSSLFNGLYKKKSNKRFLVTSFCIVNGTACYGRFPQILNPSLTAKTLRTQTSSGNLNVYNNSYALGVSYSTTLQRQTSVGGGLLIDDFQQNITRLISGQTDAIAGVYNFYAVLNIYEVEDI